MTQAEAYKVLGISRFVSPSRAEQAYLKKHNELRRKLCCGNTKEDRQKALAEMAGLMTAREIACRRPSTPKSYSPQPQQKKSTKPKPQRATASAPVNNLPKPMTLADAWDLVVTLLPFSHPVVAILFIAMVIVVLLGLLSNL